MEKSSNYKLNNLLLLSETGNLDIRNIFTDINIFESIFTPTISGYIEIVDATNIISGTKSLPLLGNEQIYIDLEVPQHKYYGQSDPIKNSQTSSNDWIDNKKYINFVGRVIDIRNRAMIRERSQIYEIHFVSEEAVLDKNMKISKSYKNKTIDYIVESIVKDFGTNATYEIEKTSGVTNVVIPNWNPIQTINWLASRSISMTYNTPTYFFFQTLYNDGPTSSDRISYNRSKFNKDFTSKFWFLSLDDMLAYDARKTIFYRPGNLPEQLPNFISPALANYAYSNSSNYEITNAFNTLLNNSNGLYNSTLITHNITYKEWKKIPYNYKDQFDKFNHLANNQIYSGVQDVKGRRFDDQEYKESKVIFSTTGTKENPNHLEKISSPRLSRLASLSYFRIRLELPGDCTLESGDIVSFEMPSPEAGGEDKFDKYYRGNFLITAIRHSINRNRYNITMECSKESLEEKVNRNA